MRLELRFTGNRFLDPKISTAGNLFFGWILTLPYNRPAEEEDEPSNVFPKNFFMSQPSSSQESSHGCHGWLAYKSLATKSA